MRLPEQVYQQVLEGLGLDPGGLLDRRPVDAPAEVPGGECKRRSGRRRLNRQVRFIRHGAADTRQQECTLLDVSRDGVCVLMDAVVAPGERFVVYLPRAADDDSGRVGMLALLCTARSSRVKTGGRFRTGAEFTDPGEADAGQTSFARSADGLTARPAGDDVWVRTAAAPVDRSDASARRTDRRAAAGFATMQLYCDAGYRGEPEDVQVRDYSETGVGIFRAEPLKVGEEFVIRVPRGEETPITRLCRVVNVAVAAGRYRIGAEFIPFPGPNGRGFFSRLKEWIA